ncbi:MAG: hypothetical protein ACJ75B_08400 [Flavisolibacter sp.]
MQQSHDPNGDGSKDIQLVLSSKNDTMSLSNHDLLKARLINKTHKPIYLAKEFDIASNLFPNGGFTGGTQKSAGFYFELVPIPPNFSIIIENDILTYPESFVRLNPKKAFDYELAVTKQIEDYNKESSLDSFKVKTNCWYTLNITFGMDGPWNKLDTFLGTVKAKPFRIFLKP